MVSDPIILGPHYSCRAFFVEKPRAAAPASFAVDRAHRADGQTADRRGRQGRSTAFAIDEHVPQG